MKPHVPQRSPAAALLRRVARFGFAFGLAYVIGIGLSRLSARLEASAAPAGFGRGLVQGAMMPCMMPTLLMGHDVVLYAQHNNGRPYKLGYTMGTTACGAVFFGILFWRLSRWRRAAHLPGPP